MRIEYHDSTELAGRDWILEQLSSSEPSVLEPVLESLCPCRTVCYDGEIWQQVVRISNEHPEFHTREGALHALVTLCERSRVDSRAVELLKWLRANCEGVYYPRWLRLQQEWAAARGKVIRYPKVSLRDVPTLIESLASEDDGLRADALRALCPGRDRRYNPRVWRALLAAQKSDDCRMRCRARTAVQRLIEHAQGDPSARAVLQLVAPETAGAADGKALPGS